MNLDALKQHKRALLLGLGAGVLLLLVMRRNVPATAATAATADTTAIGSDAAPAGLPYLGPGSLGYVTPTPTDPTPTTDTTPVKDPGSMTPEEFAAAFPPGIPGPSPGTTIDPNDIGPGIYRAAPPWSTDPQSGYWIGTPFDPSSTLVPYPGYPAYLPTENNPSGIWPEPGYTPGQSADTSTSVAATPDSGVTVDPNSQSAGGGGYWIGTPFDPTSTLVPSPGYSAYLPTEANPSGIWPMTKTP